MDKVWWLYKMRKIIIAIMILILLVSVVSAVKLKEVKSLKNLKIKNIKNCNLNKNICEQVCNGTFVKICSPELIVPLNVCTNHCLLNPELSSATK